VVVRNGAITLSSYKETSLQGDSALVKIYNKWELKLILGNEMTLVKTHDFKFEDVDFELIIIHQILHKLLLSLVLV
jgi:hypothetical protein